MTRATQKYFKEKKAKKEAKAVLSSWKPKASELMLVDVPADKREHVRQRLEPILKGLKTVDSYFDMDNSPLIVKGKDCWPVSQALVLHAMDPNIRYVEGAWDHVTDKQKYGGANPHGWATVDGYTVDLVQEFFARRDGSYEVEREPLRSFSNDEVGEILQDFGSWDVLTALTWESKNWKSIPAELRDDEDYSEDIWDKRRSFVFDTAFKDVIEKLNARLVNEGKVQAKLVVPPGMRKAFHVPEHMEGDAICVLHSIFDDAGLCVTDCPCCDDAGYTAHTIRRENGEVICMGGEVSYLEAIGRFQTVLKNIRNNPGLRADVKGIEDHIRYMLREKAVPLYQPEAFKFEVRLEPKEQEPVASSKPKLFLVN